MIEIYVYDALARFSNVREALELVEALRHLEQEAIRPYADRIVELESALQAGDDVKTDAQIRAELDGALEARDILRDEIAAARAEITRLTDENVRLTRKKKR